MPNNKKKFQVGNKMGRFQKENPYEIFPEKKVYLILRSYDSTRFHGGLLRKAILRAALNKTNLPQIKGEKKKKNSFGV